MIYRVIPTARGAYIVGPGGFEVARRELAGTPHWLDVQCIVSDMADLAKRLDSTLGSRTRRNQLV